MARRAHSCLPLAATNTYRPTNLEAEAQDGGAEEAEGTKSKLTSKIVSRSEVYGEWIAARWTAKGRGALPYAQADEDSECSSKSLMGQYAARDPLALQDTSVGHHPTGDRPRATSSSSPVGFVW